MDRHAKRSGIALTVAGVAGLLFFWLSDPRFGLAGRAAGYELIDAANEARIGTIVGLLGSLAVLGLGVWLMTRRPT